MTIRFTAPILERRQQKAHQPDVNLTENLEQGGNTLRYQVPRVLTIGDISNRLQTSAADRPFIYIKAGGLSVQPEKKYVAPEIEDRIDAGSQE